ncbi:carbohydrate ABC transporter permease [Microbacterium sp. DT81.1]|uniref:carbohydrate ABC transporter permease n=1 Tax=Microbacterium sp. DT81.1 TaxID=3393413 RepID=UPI003CF1CD39
MSTPILKTRANTVIGVLLVAFLLFPLYWMLNAALQADVSSSNITWLPLNPSLEGFQNALSTQLGNLGTSLVIALGAVVLAFIVSVPAAYALALLRLPAVPVMLGIVLITQMIPAIVVANSLYTLYNSWGLLNSFPGLILADATKGIPFSILILYAFMIAIPKEMMEAARIDGAGRIRTLVSVVVPLSRNAIITASLFTFLFAWSDLDFALTLTTDGSIVPVTLGIYQFLGVYDQDWSTLMSVSLLASVPAAVLLISAQRYIAGGISTGSLK